MEDFSKSRVAVTLWKVESKTCLEPDAVVHTYRCNSSDPVGDGRHRQQALNTPPPQSAKHESEETGRWKVRAHSRGCPLIILPHPLPPPL